MEKRYGVLRIIATIYKVLGVLAAIIALLVSLGLCASSVVGGAALGGLGRDNSALAASGMVGGFIAGIVVILYGAFLTLTLYAFGDGIYLLLALEENTRTTATLLKKMQSGESPMPSAPPPSSLSRP
jgi:hypothetical protein